MTDSPETNLLSECQLEIERAWNDSKDDAPVHRLAVAHPELADDLYDFFACVIEADDHLDRLRPEFAETDRRVREVLQRTLKDNQPKQPKTFLALVREAASGESVDALAAAMEVTADFLVVVSKHGVVLPRKAREELVRRARLTHSVNESEALASFDAPSHLKRAASRDTAFAPANITYRDVVERSSLSAAEKRFWLGLA